MSGIHFYRVSKGKMTRAQYAKAFQQAETAARRRLAYDYGIRSWKRFKEESGWKYSADCLLKHILEDDQKAKGLVADWLMYQSEQTMLKLDEREYDV